MSEEDRARRQSVLDRARLRALATASAAPATAEPSGLTRLADLEGLDVHQARRAVLANLDVLAAAAMAREKGYSTRHGVEVRGHDPDVRGAIACHQLAIALLGLDGSPPGAVTLHVTGLPLPALQEQAARELLGDDTARTLVRRLLTEYDSTAAKETT